MRHLLVTNDFPPKVGGIQSYLWELWRRLPPDQVTVLTTPRAGAGEFDRDQPFRVERTRSKVLVSNPWLRRAVDELAGEVEANLVVLDPALPLGPIGRHLNRPYAVVMHGSELLGRLPGGSSLMGRVVRGAELVIAAGPYPASEARRVGGDATPPVVEIPPGVDSSRFRPLGPAARTQARAAFGLPADAPVILGLSRLVRRKGFATLIGAGALLAAHHPGLTVAIAGAGRDEARLRRVAADAPVDVRFLGRVPEVDLPRLYASADVFCMLCHDRWFGWETEGFGIVFLEAAACGVPQVAGRSGGAADAVVDGRTGLVVDRPADPRAAAAALSRLLDRNGPGQQMAAASRERAAADFDYDRLAARLGAALEAATPG